MPDDKDRFGNKLRDKERAEEGRFFAAQDEEKLKALRERASQPKLGQCPRCAVSLDQQQLRGVTIDVCPDCKGVWLDKGELDQIIEREDESWFSTWMRDVLAGMD